MINDIRKAAQKARTSSAPAPVAQPADMREALQAARDALEEIALAGMSGTGQETEEGMRAWHARRAWEFIGIAARALDPIRDALDAAPAPVAQGEPVAWWIPKAEQFCIAKQDGSRPFAKAWEPLYAAPAPVASLSFPERDTSRPAEAQGLFRKFHVLRVDGSDAPGGKHHGCEYFVLDMDHDVHAPAALVAYANACRASHPQLSADLLARFAPPAPAPVSLTAAQRHADELMTRPPLHRECAMFPPEERCGGCGPLPAPPAPVAQPLTDEQIDQQRPPEHYGLTERWGFRDGVRFAEDAHGIKAASQEGGAA